MANSERVAFLTTQHGGGVNHTVDPSRGGVILLKVHLELHKKYGDASGWREQNRRFIAVHFHGKLILCFSVTGTQFKFVKKIC